METVAIIGGIVYIILGLLFLRLYFNSGPGDMHAYSMPIGVTIIAIGLLILLS